MKRFLLCLALGAGLLSGCSESQSVQTAAGLSGTYDLTAAGSYIFVTSTDRNELRVLDINASPRDWVRAPNPLESLSIPVLERPTNLTRDMTYTLQITQEPGKVEDRRLDELSVGHYVYARSAGAREISIVGADPGDPEATDSPEAATLFKEIYRLKASGLVTAFTALGPVKEVTGVIKRDDEGNVIENNVTQTIDIRTESILYYAVQEGQDAKLYRVVLPGPASLTRDTALTPELLEVPLAGRTVAALVVLPPVEGQMEREHLVVATRNTVGPGGETFRLDVKAPQDPRVMYDFGGPVRFLMPNAKVDSTDTAELDASCALDTTQPADPSFLAGEYVFGILDESDCTSQEQETCSGVVAVDSGSGARARDSTGLPMLPIRVGAALPTGVTLMPEAALQIRCKDSTFSQIRPLVGVIPASDGRIHFFDAAKMRPFDLSLDAAQGADHAVVDINGTSKLASTDAASNHIDLDVQEGATRDDTYRVIYQGSLQGLSARPLSTQTAECSPTSCSFYVEPQAVTPPQGEPAGMARAGDTITLANEAGACPTELSVTEVRLEDLPNGEQRGVLTAGALPQDCPSALRFTVRAGAQYPLVVYSDTRGYLGRLPPEGTGEGAASKPFKISGGYTFHPPVAGFQEREQFRTASAYLRVYNLTKTGDDPLVLARGDQLIVRAQSGYVPFAAGVDTSSTVGGLAAYRLPGPVVHTRAGDVDLAYIAYPSADGILQVSLRTIVDNAANARGLVPFE